MSFFKTSIPKSLLINAFNQVNNYLTAMNHMPDLAEISPDEYGAVALFGGEGEWDQNVDSALFHSRVTSLADAVAVQNFKIGRGRGTLTEHSSRVIDPSETTGTVFGYDELFQVAAPELL